MNIENSVVLVTGSNRGLGRALVERSLARGARKVYAGARDPHTLSELVARGAGRVVPVALDVSNPASLSAAAAAAPDVTVMFNNAGVLASYNALTSTPEQIAADLATNYFGLIAATRAFLPALERAGAASGAAVVNVLSVVSLASMPSIGGYSASKAAAFSFTQALRAELLQKGVSVHAVFPGPIDTDMVRDFDMKKTSPEAVAQAIVEGVERGLEDISPDPFSREVLATWQRSPKALEHQFAGRQA